MRNFWYCNVCHAQNSIIDGECQFCECGGQNCQRNNCSDAYHFAHCLNLACGGPADEAGRCEDCGGATHFCYGYRDAHEAALIGAGLAL